MARSELPFDPRTYAPVADRVALFWERHPGGRIVTELVERSEKAVVFRALVFRSADDHEPAATGWACEEPGSTEINAVACLENTETSAVGRALANLGFLAGRGRPSLEEMAKAERAREALRHARGDVPVRRVAEPAPALHPLDRARERRTMPSLSHVPAAHAATARLVATLLERAERLGVRPARAARWRARLTSGYWTPAELERACAWLTAWIAEHGPLGPRPPMSRG